MNKFINEYIYTYIFVWMDGLMDGWTFDITVTRVKSQNNSIKSSDATMDSHLPIICACQS